ncbi:MAG: hypothetical protein RL223_3788 [Pseudomonadota bacterium]|jgi:molybdopterin-guanine dinucleotide biosynthesis protein B
MKIFGIAGRSGMGKTTLLERLIPALRARGLSVSLIKHSHKDIEVDRPGKDSHRLREAGSQEVVLIGRSRWALMHELRGAPEPTLRELLGHLSPCDLVLIEGFKQGGFPKLEVWRPSVGQPPLGAQWPGRVAVATDATEGPYPLSDEDRPPLLALTDIEAIADCVCREAWPLQRLLDGDAAQD